MGFRGAVHSGWDLSMVLEPPDSFDDELFFSSDFSCHLAAPQLVAVEYSEILFLERDAAMTSFIQYPFVADQYLQRLIGVCWRAMCVNVLRQQLQEIEKEEDMK